MKKSRHFAMRRIILSVAIVVCAFILVFTIACQNLKMDKLKANEHFQRGNKHYADEKYKKAVMEYEEAIKLNPDLKEIYFYAGTAYSQLYKSGDEDPKNIEYGNKAVEYLQKAQEFDPANEKIIMALGYIFNKMRKSDEAEKYYLKLLEKDRSNPQAYYILADFYSSYDQGDKAVETYEKRIALDPEDPEGYLFLATYYQSKKLWDDALKAFSRRIKVLEQSNRLSEKDKKKALAEAYYTYGVVCWQKAYNTPEDIMGPKDRLAVVAEGMAALDKASEIDPLYPEPWAYKNLLLRQKAKAEPLNEKKYIEEADKMAAKFTELRKARTAQEALAKEMQQEK